MKQVPAFAMTSDEEWERRWERRENADKACASLLLSETAAYREEAGGQWTGWCTKRSWLLHSFVSFHSFLFFFFYLTFVSECTGVTVLLVREFSLSQLSCQSRSVLAIHGKDSAIVFSAEKDWSCNKWTAWMVLPNQPSHWLNEDLQHKCNTKYLASDLTILSLNLHYDKTVLLQLLKSDYFPGKIQM